MRSSILVPGTSQVRGCRSVVNDMYGRIPYRLNLVAGFFQWNKRNMLLQGVLSRDGSVCLGLVTINTTTA